ncbi:MAG: hypothetical protein QM704_24310 [Anaeromyxobacteraceae bacterium]
MPRTPDRSTLFSVLVYCAFFASGASSLFAEVTWNRMLIVVVGNSLSATAMITAVFMGGLGLGSYVAGKLLARRRASLGFYLALELAIGAYILASPSLFEALAAAFSGLAGSVPARTLLTAVRVVVTMAALLVPALLMGATFPAMVSGAASASGRTTRIGLLYSVNTLGAAVGCYLAGHRLIFEHGVHATLVGACILNVVAAGLALAARLLDRAPAEAAVEGSPAEAAAVRPGLRRFLLVATFGVGFVALAYEVLLTRLVILFIGNRGSVFAFVLTGFLIGTGISAVLGTWLHDLLARRTRSGERLFGVFSLAAAALLLAAPYVILSFGGFQHRLRADAEPAPRARRHLGAHGRARRAPADRGADAGSPEPRHGHPRRGDALRAQHRRGRPRRGAREPLPRARHRRARRAGRAGVDLRRVGDDQPARAGQERAALGDRGRGRGGDARPPDGAHAEHHRALREQGGAPAGHGPGWRSGWPWRGARPT